MGYNNYTTWCSSSFVSVFVSTIMNDLIRLISTRPSATFSLIRGSETRHVSVSVPLAKLDLTICHEVKGALERSFIVIRDESFPSKHSQDSYN